MLVKHVCIGSTRKLWKIQLNQSWLTITSQKGWTRKRLFQFNYASMQETSRPRPDQSPHKTHRIETSWKFQIYLPRLYRFPPYSNINTHHHRFIRAGTTNLIKIVERSTSFPSSIFLSNPLTQHTTTCLCLSLATSRSRRERSGCFPWVWAQ